MFKGKRLNSQAVVANAWHHRSDALSSIGTAIGIGGAILLGNHWRVLDPIAAVVVSFFIMKVAVKLLIPCVDELLEKSLPADVENEIQKIILFFSRSKFASPFAYPPYRELLRDRGACAHGWKITLEEAHRTATAIENTLKEQFGKGTHVGIHVEPVK